MLASLFFLNYCNNYKQLTSQTEVLFRHKWKLAELDGQVVADTTRSTFEFTPGRISGSAGCDWLSADFIPGKHQTIRFVVDTTGKKECGNQPAATLETRFWDAISKSTKWDLNGGQLWLGDGGMTLIKLRSL